MKAWLLKRRHAFGQRAQDYGLPTPKGLLILGIAGTGKSLTAKATAKVFGVPLLKLDAGRLFAGLVGQSEANLRSVIQTAEAIAPCCLWIDELEKAFAGSKSSGATDGGTSSRTAKASRRRSQVLRNASRSALSWSLCVSARPCGAPG